MLRLRFSLEYVKTRKYLVDNIIRRIHLNNFFFRLRKTWVRKWLHAKYILCVAISVVERDWVLFQPFPSSPASDKTSLSWVKSNVLDELPSYLAAKDRFLSISNSTYLPTYILLTLLKSIEKVISTLSKNIKRGIGNKSSKKPELKTKKKYFPFLPLPKNSSIYLFDISKILVILYGLVTREIGIS